MDLCDGGSQHYSLRSVAPEQLEGYRRSIEGAYEACRYRYSYIDQRQLAFFIRALPIRKNSRHPFGPTDNMPCWDYLHDPFAIWGDSDALTGFFELEILQQLYAILVLGVVFQASLSSPCEPVWQRPRSFGTGDRVHRHIPELLGLHNGRVGLRDDSGACLGCLVFLLVLFLRSIVVLVYCVGNCEIIVTFIGMSCDFCQAQNALQIWDSEKKI
jgi:hypothetical protein